MRKTAMKPSYKQLDGINIQWPWSELLLSGVKTIETRSYPLPKRLYGIELAVIETPGKRGNREAGIGKARIIGTIIFSGSYRYSSKSQWVREYGKHRVPQDDGLYSYRSDKDKWAWVVEKFKKLDRPAPPPAKRGIIFAKNCLVPAKYK